MFRNGSRVDNYVVVEVDQRGLLFHTGQYDVERSLECRGPVFETERHAQKVVEARMRRERSFTGILLGDLYLPLPAITV